MITLYCFGFAGVALGQQVSLEVILKYEDRILLPGIVLMHLPDSIIISSKIASDELMFSVESGDDYLLRVTAVGKQPVEKSFTAPNAPFTITVNLANKIDNLENVVVISRKPLIRYEDDKTIVDAEVLATSSTNAYEVLEKTPGAVVDQDGNVYLNSATPATIFINGREMKLSAADLASLLKSLPANSITKIEILRTPSAKYDAASSGGIVNIVLKKGIKLGTNGSVNIASFQGKYNTFTTGFNLNKGNQKLNSNISYQYTRRNNFEELNSTRFISADSSQLTQYAYTRYPSSNHYAGLGLDYAANKKFNIGYDFRLSANDNNSDAENTSLIQKQSNLATLANIQSRILNNGASSFVGNSLSSKYKIDSLGSEIIIGTDYNFYRGDNQQQYKNQFITPTRAGINGDGNTGNDKKIFTITADWVQKFKGKFTLEAGAKYNSSKSRNSALYYIESLPGQYKLDSFQTNRFTYNEKITASYLQVSKTFYGFTLKPGLRLEYTDIAGQQLFPKDTSLAIRRTDVFPYVYLRREIAKLFGFMLTGNAIYRKSITRPYYEALNPYPKYIDQFLYDVGNPSLKPQFTTNYELNVTAMDFPVFSVGINDIKDIFTNVTYQDEATKIAYRTYDNLGRNKELYLRFAGGIPPGGKYFFYAVAQYNRSHYTGLYQNQPFEFTNGSWVFFTYHNYKASPTLNLSMHGFLRTNGLQSFYQLKNYGSLNVNVNKALLNKKANIILAVNDVFNSRNVQFKIQQAGIYAVGERLNDNRKIGLTFRYNFGIKPREENKLFMNMPADIGK